MAADSIGTTFGALLLASWLATGLSGIVYYQSYIFFRSRPSHDSTLFSNLVITLCILDAAHIVCSLASLYHYLIVKFGRPDALLPLIPPLALTVGLTALITFITQAFFARRVWKLSRHNKIITAMILVVSFGRLCCGWATSIQAIRLGTFTAFAVHLRFLFTTGVALAVVSDLLITGSLYYWLNETRSGNKSTDAIIDKIIRYTIETGALVSVVSISSLLCVIIMPANLVFIAIHLVISKLYINSLLASSNRTFRLAGSLNSRNLHRSNRQSNGQILSRMRFGPPPAATHSGSNIFVLVNQDQEIQRSLKESVANIEEGSSKSYASGSKCMIGDIEDITMNIAVA